MITVIGVSASIVQIVGGILVFGDPLPSGALGMVAQSFGFVLVCAAAILVPAPTRVTPMPQTA